MKLTTGILAAVMMTGGSWAQNPNIIGNVQNQMTAVEHQKAADSNQALGIQATPGTSTASKPAPGSAAPAAKPAVMPSTKPSAAPKPVSAQETKPVKSTPAKPSAAGANAANKLEHVNVVRHADNVQIEFSTRDSVTPSVDKLSSPDRVVIELPSTAMATEQSKIAIAAAGIKAVRIGMNSKTPPTTSVVVDLEHPVQYELSPGPSSKFVLTLHAHGAGEVIAAQTPAKTMRTATAKPMMAAPVAPAKPMATAPKATVAVKGTAQPPAKPAIVAVSNSPQSSKPVPNANLAANAKIVAMTPQAVKPMPAGASKTVAASVPAAKTPATAAKITAAPATKIVATSAKPATTIVASKPTTTVAADEKIAPISALKAPKPEEKKWAMTGKHDPFISPVVLQTGGSGCSTGKKCLEIGQINVRGVVKSQDGFIAVVTNSMNKAYFLHENDPVFNGFVLKITGDSVVFQETYQDKLGKPLTREVTKRITAPAV